jgi:hypothetical protein
LCKSGVSALRVRLVPCIYIAKYFTSHFSERLSTHICGCRRLLTYSRLPIKYLCCTSPIWKVKEANRPAGGRGGAQSMQRRYCMEIRVGLHRLSNTRLYCGPPTILRERAAYVTAGWFTVRLLSSNNKQCTLLPNYCIRFVVYTRFKNVASGRIMRPVRAQLV